MKKGKKDYRVTKHGRYYTIIVKAPDSPWVYYKDNGAILVLKSIPEAIVKLKEITK